MSVFEGSAKDYAASIGLATAGRGRMNKDALEAVAKARSEGMTFSKEISVVSSQVKVKFDKPPAPEREVSIKSDKPATDYDVGAVRQWAKDNGHEVSDRGRVSSELKTLYGAANPDAEKAAPKGKDLRESAPRTSPTGTLWTTENSGQSVIISEKVACGNCGYSLGWHTCKTPVAVVGYGGDLVPVIIRG